MNSGRNEKTQKYRVYFLMDAHMPISISSPDFFTCTILPILASLLLKHTRTTCFVNWLLQDYEWPFSVFLLLDDNSTTFSIHVTCWFHATMLAVSTCQALTRKTMSSSLILQACPCLHLRIMPRIKLCHILIGNLLQVITLLA